MDRAKWWRSRGRAPAGRGNAWSGGGRAYRDWMASGPKGSPWRPRRSGRSRGSGGEAGPLRLFAEILLFLLPGGWLARHLLRRWRVGVSLGVVAAGGAAILFAAPLAWAGTVRPCAAAEAALVDERLPPGGGFEAARRRVANWTGLDGKLFSRGRVARQIVAEEHPGWPPFAACTALFWRARAASASVDGIMISLLRGPALRR